MSRKCHLHGELEEALGCVLVVLGQAERVGELRDVALAYGACLGHVVDVSWTGLVCELRDVALPLERATSRDSLAKPRPDERSPEDGTNWPTTPEPPPADVSKVTSLTIVFSSRTVPHWMHTASPRAASSSMSVPPQWLQVRPFRDILSGADSGR